MKYTKLILKRKKKNEETIIKILERKYTLFGCHMPELRTMEGERERRKKTWTRKKIYKALY